MLRNVLSLSFLLLSQIVFGQNWTTSFDSIVTFSSPRPADLNNDGVDDIIIGSGVEQENRIGVSAIDGKTGKILWQQRVDDELFGSAIFQDINKDSIPDVFIGGRSAEFYALDGKTGNVIWEFYPFDKTYAVDSGWYNFYHPQWINDQDNDGLNDLLIVNGGDPSMSYADTANRPAGSLMTISALTGKVIIKAKSPDGREMYMSPVVYDFNKDGNKTIIFGTGGETYSGGLYKIQLSDYLKDHSIKKAQSLIFTSKRGFIPPPCIADLDGDSTLDLIVQGYNATIYALDGNNFELMWKVKNPGHETQCTPAIGNFTGSHHPDVFAVLYKGKTPTFKSFRQLLIDGKTGQVRYRDSLSNLHFASPAAFDYNGDGRDEAVCSYNFYENGIWRHAIHLLDFAKNKTYKLINNDVGSNLATTPLIDDIDHNGKLDIIYAHRLDSFSPQATNGFAVKRLADIANLPYTGVAWGSYMGTLWDGTYHYTGKNCKDGPGVSGFVENPWCNGTSTGKITVGVKGNNGPYNFSWSHGGSEKNSNFLEAGTHYLRTVDKNGCQSIDSFHIEDPFYIEHSGYEGICIGDTNGWATVSSSGCKCANSGCIYTWSTGLESHSMNNVKAGKYWVKLEHANGCIVYDTVVVPDPAPIIDSFSFGQLKCFGDTNGWIEFFPNDPLDFKSTWSHGPKNKNYIYDLKKGTYTVFLNDWKGCLDTLTVDITEPDSFHFAIDNYNHITCHNAKNGQISLETFGGTPEYSYWINGKVYKDSFIKKLDTGTYNITVVDANGCITHSETQQLLQPSQIELFLFTRSETQIFAENGAAWVKPKGGVPPYTYLWNDPNDQRLDSISGLKAGKYKVIVTDSKDCSVEGEIEVPLSVGIQTEKSNNSTLVYPNPTTGLLTIELENKAQSKLEIYNMNGQLLLESQLNQLQNIVNLSSFAKGVYELEITGKNNKEHVRLIIE